ncbi:MAG: CHAT domain-containing tetratricopeptide repeat protein [Acidobacteriota bacterium]
MKTISRTAPVMLWLFLLVVCAGSMKGQERGALLKDHIQQGLEMRRLGRFEQAAEIFESVLQQARNGASPSDELECLMQLGVLNWNLGRMQESDTHYSRALPLAERMAGDVNVKRCREFLDIHSLYRMGKQYRQDGDRKQSILHFDQAVQKARGMRSLDHELKCLRQLSITYWDLNELVMFLKLNEEALELAQTLNHAVEQGRCLNHLGLYYWKTDEDSQALVFYKKALTIARSNGRTEEESGCLNNIGLIYKNMGYFRQALLFLEDALRIDRKAGDKEFIAIDLNNIGTIHMQLAEVDDMKERYQSALPYFMECLQIAGEEKDQKTKIRALSNIGMIHYHLGRPDEAETILEQVIEEAGRFSEWEVEAMSLNNLGAVRLQRGEMERAVSCFERALHIAERIQHQSTLWEAWWRLGLCREAMGEYEGALDSYQKAAGLIERIRSRLTLDTAKAGYFSQKYRVYESMQDILYSRYRISQDRETGEALLKATERSRARAFLEMASASGIDFFQRADTGIREEEQRLSLRISTLLKSLYFSNPVKEKNAAIEGELEKAEREYMDLLSACRRRFPETAELAAPEISTLEEIQKSLSGRSAALCEYALGEKQSYLFWVTEEDLRIYRLPGRKDVRESVRGFLKLLSRPPRRRFTEHAAAQRLFKEFLFPLAESEGREIKNLIIVPDGVLYALPFEALVYPQETGRKRGEFLIERCRVSYAPSASSLLFLMRRPERQGHQKDLGAFGGPDYSAFGRNGNSERRGANDILNRLYSETGFDLSPLPQGKREVKSVAGFFAGNRREVLTGEDVTEKRIKSIVPSEFRILHFACHALLDERFPWRSALLFSPAEEDGEDGFLQVREIYNLQLNADLVVLSGCQTGKGSVSRGEGLLGLPRIFFYTGARTVVSTLWPIEDRSAADMMRSFYGRLRRGESAADALRNAKRRMIDKGVSHPFFWSPYVLYGDFDPLGEKSPFE